MFVALLARNSKIDGVSKTTCEAAQLDALKDEFIGMIDGQAQKEEELRGVNLTLLWRHTR